MLLLTFSFPTNALASIIQIGDKTQLLSIGVLDVMPLSGDYELTSSIILDPAVEDDNPATIDTYINGTLTGTFDGNGYTISGLTRPLFNDIGGDSFEDKAIVKDLVLVTAESGVAGRGILSNNANSYVLIENVGTKGIISGGAVDSVGGIVGSLTVGFETSGLITKSFSTASVYGDDNVGGLVGVIGTNGEITESYSNGSVTGDQYIGGLVGITYGNISNSYATGKVSGDSSVGGFTGSLFNNKEIINSYASGSVLGTNNHIGGFAGELWYGDIINSFSISSVDGAGDNIAGFVGYKNSGSITNSYSTGSVTGVSGVSTDRFIIPKVSFESAYGTGSETYLVGGASTTVIYDGPPTPGMFTTVNTGNKYGIVQELNNGLPYLLSLRDTYQSSSGQESQNLTLGGSGIFTLKIETKNEVSASIGFLPSNSDLKDIKIQFISTSNDTKNEQISGLQANINQTSQVFVKVGEGLQLTLTSTFAESLQLWARSPEGEFIIVGLISFDENGRAILPAMVFNDSGQFEFIFIDSDSSSLDTLELKNRLGSLVINVE